jgi:hypothetical protein
LFAAGHWRPSNLPHVDEMNEFIAVADAYMEKVTEPA